MGYQRSDDRSGSYDERRDRDRERGRFERERGFGGRDDYRRGYDDDDDRGFFDRAGDEVRSWFGDEEAERRRDEDRRRYENEGGEYRGSDYRGWDYGAGRGERGRERAQSRGYQGRSSERRYGGYAPENYASGPGTSETFSAGSPFGSRYDRARRLEQPDAGTGEASYGSLGGTAGAARSFGGARGGREYDPHYSEWRRRQIDALDRDYDDYRREHQSRFEREFHSWRENRQGKRQLLNRVTEHMEVIGSDDQHIGTVDKVRGDRIFLTRSDPSAGGHHHSIPCDWVEKVEDKVTISKSAEEARTAWRDEETNRALFERDDQGSEGPHILGRSFSGTYRE